jgi:hypothetical protein
MSEQEKLMSDIRQALQKMRYTSAATGYERALAPQQLEAIMTTLEPVIGNFFKDHLIQAKNKIWD